MAASVDDEAPAIACTLGPDALVQRLAWIGDLIARSLLAHRLEGTTLRLTYGPEALPALEQFVALERECCAFLRFTLQEADGRLLLAIEAPQGLGAQARWLFDHFLPAGTVAPGAPSTKRCACAQAACG